MNIIFKEIGDNHLSIEKDTAGIIHISICDGDNSIYNTIPLSNRDINNLIKTLKFLSEMTPDNLQEDSFPSVNKISISDGVYVDPDMFRPAVSTSARGTTRLINTNNTDIVYSTYTNANDETPF